MASRDQLSEKQIEILNYIISQQNKNGYPPCVREICEAANLKSTSTIHGHLVRLEKKGYIRRDPSKPRAIEIIKSPLHADTQPEKVLYPEYDSTPASVEVSTIPILGKVAAGAPILAVQNIDDYLTLPLQIIGGSSEGRFALRVKGESMIKAGIMDGDLIIVRQQKTAHNGEIVVALIDDSVTCKRFYKEDRLIRLQPENDAMQPIYVPECSILGKVIGVYRKID